MKSLRGKKQRRRTRRSQLTPSCSSFSKTLRLNSRLRWSTAPMTGLRRRMSLGRTSRSTVWVDQTLIGSTQGAQARRSSSASSTTQSVMSSLTCTSSTVRRSTLASLCRSSSLVQRSKKSSAMVKLPSSTLFQLTSLRHTTSRGVRIVEHNCTRARFYKHSSCTKLGILSVPLRSPTPICILAMNGISYSASQCRAIRSEFSPSPDMQWMPPQASLRIRHDRYG